MFQHPQLKPNPKPESPNPVAAEYYIRIRGVVKGPLTHDQILAQIRRKRLGRHHEMSLDAITWQKAGDLPELFAPDLPQRDTADPIAQSDFPASAEAVPAEAIQLSAPPEPEWFYSKNGGQLGPVTEAELNRLFASGKLNSATLVWKEGFEKWILASELPEFASTFVQSQPTQPLTASELPRAGFWEIFMGTSQAAVLPADSIHKYPNLTRYLKISETSARVLFVLLLTLLLIGCCAGIGIGTSTDEWRVVAGSCVLAPVGSVVLWLSFITWLATLELIRVWIKIEENTAK